MDEAANHLDQLVPPAGLQEFHNANIDALRSLRDAAQARPSGDFLEDLFAFLEAFLIEALTIAFDPTLTDEQKEQATEETLLAMLSELFGPDIYHTDKAARDAFEALPAETQTILGNTEWCGASVFFAGGSTSEPGEPTEDDYADDISGAASVNVGTPVPGAINYQGDVDVFRFTAQEGQFYQIDVELGTLGDSRLDLLDSDGWTLASNDDFGGSQASRIVWQAPGAGDFYVAVEGWGNSTGSYTLTVAPTNVVDDYANDIADAAAINVATPVPGALDYEGDVDIFSFTAQEGQLYQIDAELGTLDDSYLQLLDSEGWALVSNDDFGDSLASRIVWPAPDSGDYYIEVAGGWSDSVGSYTLTISLSDIQDDHANDIAGATPATVGQAVQGAIDYGGDVDIFSFTAQEGQLYQIDAELGTLNDSRLELLESDGWALASNDDFGDSLASRIVWKAPSAGDYYLAVEGFGGDGSYTLTVALSSIVDDYADDIAGATPATVGQAVQGAIDYGGDVDVFSFTAQAGVLYQIDVELGTLNDSRLELLDSEAWTLASNDDFGDSLASRIVWRAPSAGDYYLAVEGFGGDGSYTLTVSLSSIVDDYADDIAGAGAITVGQAVQGELDYGGDVDVFRFAAQAGVLYQIDVALGTLGDSVVQLLDANGWTVESNDDHGGSLASRIFWEAPSAGEYYVAVEGYGTGSYTLTVAVR